MYAGHATLKVLHIASGDLWAGAEVQIEQLLSKLNGLADVDVAAILLNEGELADRLRSGGVKTRVFPESSLPIWSLLRSTVAFAREWQPDVIHTHRQKENILGAIAAKAARVPFCLRTVHGMPEHPAKPWLPHKAAVAALEALAAKTVQRSMVAVSDELAGRIHDRCPNAIIAVIPNGIDTAALRRLATPRICLTPNEVHIAFVGRLVRVKRVDVFLRAAAHLVQSGHGQFRFHVIGDGPLMTDLVTLSRALDLDSHCTFHGFLPDAPRWVAAMNCVVLTSEHEGLPMSALEAIALGIPVVAHAVGGLPSLLRDCGSSTLFFELTPGAVADAILNAAARPVRQPELPAEYSADTMAAAYLSLYRKHLEQKS